MSKRRVLILENSIAVTGALKSILRSSLYLRDWYDFVFVLPSGSQAVQTVKAQGFVCEQLPMREVRKNFFSLIIYFPYLLLNTIRLKKLVSSGNIDMIVNNDFYNLLPVAYRFFGGEVPYVSYVRFLPSKFPQILVRFWSACHHRYAARVIAVSNAVKKELPYKNNALVINNELPQAEDVVFSPSRSKLILYPANYIKGKGHEYALESFSNLHKKHPDWKLRFVGGDMGLEKNKRYKQSLIKTASELGMSDRIEWLGFVSDIDTHYLAASIILNFSESESFSLTCLEGMFYGRTVIATDCGGPSEIIDDGITGMLVPIKDIGRMCDAMDLIMSNPARREELAAKGYTCVREKFSNSKITDELHKIYDTALTNKTPTFNKR